MPPQFKLDSDASLWYAVSKIRTTEILSHLVLIEWLISFGSFSLIILVALHGFLRQ